MTTQETGPIYNSVPLIDTLPIPGSTMKQAMPSRRDLYAAALRSTRTVAGYEVLLCHWHNQNERIKELTEACENLLKRFEGGVLSDSLIREETDAIRAAIAKAKEPT